MVVLANRAKVSTTTTGTGSITLGSAIGGFQTFEDAGISDGNSVRYTIEDGDNWEIGTGVYSSTGPTLTRSILDSSNYPNLIDLSGGAVVYITAAGEDLQHAADMDQGVATSDSPTFNDLYVDGTINGALADDITNAAGNWHIFVNDGGGNIGQRWNSTTGATPVLVEDGIAYQLRIDNDTAGGDFRIDRGTTANNAAGEAITWDNAFRINGADGYVGIAKTTPTEPLHVGGNIKSDGSITGNSITATNGSVSIPHNTASLLLGEGGYTGPHGIYFYQADGDVGIKELYRTSPNNLSWELADDTVLMELTQAGDVAISGTVNGRDIAADGTKLDGIEAGADVTDTTNVTAAGALMDSELTDITAVKGLDQGVATTDNPTFAGLAVDGDLLLEGGDHRISYDDGGGNFNIRAGHYYDLATDDREEYSTDSEGAIHIKAAHRNPNPNLSIKLGEPSTNALAGAEVVWDKEFNLSGDGTMSWDGDILNGESTGFYSNGVNPTSFLRWSGRGFFGSSYDFPGYTVDYEVNNQNQNDANSTGTFLTGDDPETTGLGVDEGVFLSPWVSTAKARLNGALTDSATTITVHSTSELVEAGSFTVGQTYTIYTTNDINPTDFTLIGAADNNVGTTFVATGAGSGSGFANHVGNIAFPSSGIIRIGAELIQYSAVTETTFTVVARGYDPTGLGTNTAMNVAHSDEAVVTLAKEGSRFAGYQINSNLVSTQEKGRIAATFATRTGNDADGYGSVSIISHAAADVATRQSWAQYAEAVRLSETANKGGLWVGEYAITNFANDPGTQKVNPYNNGYAGHSKGLMINSGADEPHAFPADNALHFRAPYQDAEYPTQDLGSRFYSLIVADADATVYTSSDGGTSSATGKVLMMGEDQAITWSDATASVNDPEIAQELFMDGDTNAVVINRTNAPGSTPALLDFRVSGTSKAYFQAATGGINIAGGNLGINTTSPSEALDVVGNIAVSGDVSASTVTVTSTGLGDLAGDEQTAGRFTVKPTFHRLNLDVKGRRIVDGTNWNRTEVRLEHNIDDVDATRTWIAFHNDSGSTTDNILRFGEGVETEWARFDNGSLAVGVTTPDSMLHVSGNIHTNSSAYVDANLYVDTDTLFVDATNDRVGINTATPSEALHVAGTGNTVLVSPISYSSNQDSAYLIAGTSGYTGETTNWNTFGFQHRIKSNASGLPRVTIDNFSGEKFSVSNDGTVTVTDDFVVDTDTLYVDASIDAVGIGTDTPVAKLHVAGAAKIEGGLYLDSSVTENVYTLTDAASVDVNPSNGTIQTLTLTGTGRTLTFNSFTNGQFVTLMVNDGTSGTITTWNATFVNGGGAPTLSTTGYTVVSIWKVGGTVYAATVGND